MAGFDLDFETSARYRSDTKGWLDYLRRLASRYDLEVQYQTKVLDTGKLYVYCKVDGPLPAMQQLDRRIVQEAIRYAIATGREKTLQRFVLGPFLSGFRRGVDGMAQFLFAFTKRHPALRMETASMAVSAKTAQRVRKRRLTRLDRAVQTVIGALDGWLSGEKTNRDAVILCDQGVEDWLKVKLGLAANSRAGFHDVVDQGVQSGLLSAMEAYRLRRFHRTRNRVQHRGGRVRPHTVASMLSYCSRLIDSKS